MDILDKFFKKFSYKFPKGYPDINDAQDMLMLEGILKEMGVELNEASLSGTATGYPQTYGAFIKYVQDINKKSYNFNLSTLYENIQYTEYSSDYKGHYGWHMDINGDYPFNLRKISVSIQLSSPDEYEGGDLEIFNGTKLDTPFIVPKTRGTICIFPSFLLHRVTPIIKGTRRSLVVWVGGSHFN